MSPLARALTVLTRYVDEFGATSDLSLPTGSAIDTYGVDQLVNDNPAHLFRTTSTTVRIVFGHDAKTVLALLALIHATTESTDDVRLQANDTDVWTSPAFDMVFPQAGWRATGTRRWPKNSVTYPSAEAGYSTAGYFFHSLIFGGTTPLAQDLEIGNIKLYSDYLQLTADFREGMGRSNQKRSISHETGFGVETIYPRNINKWEQTGSIIMQSPQAAELEAHHYDVNGRALPFVVVPNALRNNCYFCRRTDEHSEAVEFYLESDDDELITVTLPLREVGRGLRPGD